MSTFAKPLPSGTPQRFHDDLGYRAFPYRFRRIGSPFAFLNDVGIVPILEFLYKGNLLIDVAQELDVPLTTLQAWISNEGHQSAIDVAEEESAEGYLALGYRKLREANNDFDLKKSKEMIKHAQFMAPRKDRKVYGGASEADIERASVKYVFNIGAGVPAAQAKDLIASVVATQPAPTVPSLTISTDGIVQRDQPIGVLFGSLAHLEETMPLQHIEEPTADNPERGPFYDAPEVPTDG